MEKDHEEKRNDTVVPSNLENREKFFNTVEDDGYATPVTRPYDMMAPSQLGSVTSATSILQRRSRS